MIMTLCLILLASVSITPLTRNVSRLDIECPGDTIPFRCSILSNSETIQLTWHITFPDKMPITITYDNTSIPNTVDILETNVTAILASYVKDEFVESIITLMVLNSVAMNQTEIKCSSEDLDSTAIEVYVNTSGI